MNHFITHLKSAAHNENKHLNKILIILSHSEISFSPRGRSDIPSSAASGPVSPAPATLTQRSHVGSKRDRKDARSLSLSPKPSRGIHT